ncbi:MAG: hypothetical protein ABIO92_05075 [Chloroflexia bacterium]
MTISGDTRDERLAILKELPPLMPRFLLRRRVGAPVVATLMSELELDRPDFFVMVQLHQVMGSYSYEPITLAQIRHYYPYHFNDPFTPSITLLKEKNLLEGDATDGMTLTKRALDAMERLHTEAKEHVSHIEARSLAETDVLARQLETASKAIIADPVLSPRPGSHLAGSRSQAAFGNTKPAMVRIEQAVYDLWMARDDAHMKVWRDAEMEALSMSIWTLLWNGDATTTDGIAAKLSMQTKATVESNLAYLFEREYVTRQDDTLQLTPEGILAREDIERETDRIYFASWPHIESEAARTRNALRDLIDRLPAPPT